MADRPSGTVLLTGITLMLTLTVTGLGVAMLDVRSAPAPDAMFDCTYDASDHQLTVVHEGGDTVDGSRLVVHTADAERPWGDGPVTAGETLRLSVDPDETVRLVWEESDRSVTLVEWQGPDA